MIKAKQRIIVFQQDNKAESKIHGILDHAGDKISIEVISIDTDLPVLIDDTFRYFPESINGDLVLNFLTHPDLVVDLSVKCHQLGIPVVASGKRFSKEGTYIPPT